MIEIKQAQQRVCCRDSSRSVTGSMGAVKLAALSELKGAATAGRLMLTLRLIEPNDYLVLWRDPSYPLARTAKTAANAVSA